MWPPIRSRSLDIASKHPCEIRFRDHEQRQPGSDGPLTMRDAKADDDARVHLVRSGELIDPA
jgi:hypothetical protein